MNDFMDKLAEKITAQDMIRANTTAEIKELGEVKAQVQELKECTLQMREIAEKLQRESTPNQPLELGAEFDRMRDELFELGAEFTAFEDALAKLQESVDGLNSASDHPVAAEQSLVDLTGVESRVGELRTMLEELGSETADLRASLVVIEGSMNLFEDNFGVSKQSFDELRGTLGEIQSAVAGLGEDRCLDEEESYREDFNQVREECQQVREECQQICEEINALKEEIQHTADRIGVATERSSAKNAETMDAFKRYLLDKLEQKKDGTGLEEMKDLLREQRDALEECRASLAFLQEDYDKKLTGVQEGIRESFHKECVKLYRNVQAATGEENEKQSTELQGIIEKVEKKNRLTLIFAGLALAASTAGVALQVLSLLHIL